MEAERFGRLMPTPTCARNIALVLLVACVLTLLNNFSSGNEQQRQRWDDRHVIRARELVLEDDRGAQRLVLELAEGRLAVTAYASDGSPRIIANVEDDRTGLVMLDGRDKVGAIMNIGTHTRRLSLFGDDDIPLFTVATHRGVPSLLLRDQENRQLLFRSADDFAGLVFFASNKLRLKAGVSGDAPMIRMYDEAVDEIWTAPR